MKKVGDFIHYPDIGTPPVYVQYKGIFDMQDIYESIADFFRQKKFKFYETQQRLRKPGPFGSEILYQFKATRKVEEYYEWVVNITIETFDMHDVEVVLKDGKKKKMAKGRIWIQILGKVEMDYEKRWEKSAFLAQLKGFYHKYIIKKTIEDNATGAHPINFDFIKDVVTDNLSRFLFQKTAKRPLVIPVLLGV